MSRTRWSHAVLIIPLLARLTFGLEEAYNKFVCEGDSVKLFNSVQIDNNDTIVHIYKNDDKHGSIAWFTRNTPLRSKTMVMDFEKNIWIINVHRVDEAVYILQIDYRTETPSKIRTHLSVWVAPATTCKPVIKRTSNVLTATLSDNGCGIPMAFAYWKDCSGVSCESTHTLTLLAGREAGMYYACTKGPALSCARSSDPSTDYCSFYKIEQSTGGNTTQTGSDVRNDDLHKWLIPIIILQFAVVVLVLLFGIKAWRALNILCCTRNQRNDPNGVNPDGQERNQRNDRNGVNPDGQERNQRNEPNGVNPDGQERNQRNDLNGVNPDGQERNQRNDPNGVNPDGQELIPLLDSPTQRES